MGKYNFDEIIDRRGSDCIKWDALKRDWGRDDLLPMWIADMDFKTPPFVMETVQNLMASGVFGYTMTNPHWAGAVAGWQRRRHSFEVAEDEIIFIPGIVRGMAFVEQCFTEPGDKVMVMPPIYHPFFLVTERNHRTPVYSALDLDERPCHPELGIDEGEHYHINWERFESDIKGCKLLLLCNPHNPGGRVWRRDELERIAEIAYDNHVLVISDEIHSDLTFKPYTHIPFPSVSEKAAQNCIMFGAPTKAFNMPGLVSSYAIVKNAEIREKFLTWLEASEYDDGCMFSYASCIACYEKGDEWLDELLEYLQGNIDFVQSYLKNNIPAIGMIRPQASYLIFLDCRKLGMSQAELVDFFIDKAHLALNDGSSFRPEGTGFMRLNVGCPRSMVKQALDQLADAVRKLNK